jgi:hypothetical protein
LFFPSIANCKKLKIQKIQKSTFPTEEAYPIYRPEEVHAISIGLKRAHAMIK